jgi:hypothetical protein
MTNDALLAKAVLNTPETSLEEVIKTIEKRVNILSKKTVLDEYQKGNILFLYDDKLAIPTFIPYWAMIYHGRPVVFINITPFATTKDGKNFSGLTVTNVFALMQGAATLLKCIGNFNAISGNVNITTNFTKAFVALSSRVLDRIYSLYSDQTDSDKAKLLLATYHTMYVCESRLSQDAIYNICYGMTSGKTPSNLLRGYFDTIYEKFKSLDASKTMFEALFDEMKKITVLNQVTMEMFVLTWPKSYGQNSLFVMESFPYGIASLLSSLALAGFINDKAVEAICSKEITEIGANLFKNL